MSQYFPELHEHSVVNVKAELDLSNYAMMASLKRTTSMPASKTDLAGLKAKTHNLDVGKLKNAPTDLSKLTNVQRLKMYTKRHQLLVGWSKILTTTQKLQRLKTKYLILLIRLTKLLSIQKPQTLKTKYLIPHVLSLLLNFIGKQKYVLMLK